MDIPLHKRCKHALIAVAYALFGTAFVIYVAADKLTHDYRYDDTLQGYLGALQVFNTAIVIITAIAFVSGLLVCNTKNARYLGFAISVIIMLSVMLYKLARLYA